MEMIDLDQGMQIKSFGCLVIVDHDAIPGIVTELNSLTSLNSETFESLKSQYANLGINLTIFKGEEVALLNNYRAKTAPQQEDLSNTIALVLRTGKNGPNAEASLNIELFDGLEGCIWYRVNQ